MLCKNIKESTQIEVNCSQLEQVGWYLLDEIKTEAVVQSMFLQKRDLEIADFYDALALVKFGQDVDER